MHPKPFAITLDPASSRANHTGSWRTLRPVYVDRLPPCNNACPAGEDIQRWLYLAEEGRYQEAWQALVRDNPLPAVHGRVCYHPCQDACNRGQLDQAVNIHGVERFLGDEAIRLGWELPPGAAASGQRVLVIGAGPSGLSAAYHLRRLGHEVEIRDAAPLPGGMMRYGIPRYRLPRDILDAEIARIQALGVRMQQGAAVADVGQAMAEGGFHACFLATGAQLARRTEIPAPDARRLLDAVAFLREAASGQAPPQLGRVVVYGGGNTAMDAARTAQRLGSTETLLVYRRDRAHMPAHDFEATEAIEEGVVMHWLRSIRGLDGSDLTVEVMALDEQGRPHPTGALETLHADTVILALGQEADTGFLAKVPGVRRRGDGTLEVDGQMRTGHPGLFAGGDMVPGERTVTVAVGHGKQAARHIDGYLRQQASPPPPPRELASFSHLNTFYYGDASPAMQPVLALSRRRSTFDEVVGGLTADTALFEARRCLSCGNCFECDNCYGVCPDSAVLKLGPGKRFAIDYDFCKGCGLCAAECPCGAIEMVPEEG